MTDRMPELDQELVGRFVGAAHGDPETVRRLLAEQPALLNARWDTQNETALEAAAHMGRRDIAEHLLETGAPNSICCAAMLGRSAEVDALLAADPALARAKGAHGIPLLYHVALGGRTDIADRLAALGGAVEVGPALHGAVRAGHVEMARWLIDRGADLETPNFQGRTPLQVALAAGQTDLVALLRERGAREPA